jgi:hypothetical protein
MHASEVKRMESISLRKMIENFHQRRELIQGLSQDTELEIAGLGADRAVLLRRQQDTQA